ncbi:MAG: Gfo/Idh/MocA family oxidoreductase [Planctomycetia bacterium]|nr:Gfo/Idh/MocA family oxidoreductase [Planctomycetia bacterium]
MFTRREFLEAAAAGTAVALTVAQARALAAPSAKIRLAVMGVNGRGSGLARGFAELEGCEVAFVCDVDSRATAKTAKNIAALGVATPKEIADFRKALEGDQIDALVIAAPDHWHAPATILACQAGKHVYCEKPACHNPREGELMIAAARKHQRVVQHGTQRRSSPEIAEAMRRLQKQEIGRVLMARGWINSTRENIGRGKKTSPPDWLNYELWQGPAPERPYQDNLVHYRWHWFWHYGTGELGNNGVHALDLCRWGLGVDTPRSAVCAGGKFHFDDDQETPDTQLATFHFGDKMIHWEHRTWSTRGFEGSLWGAAFYGEEGTLVIADKTVKVLDMDDKVVLETPVHVGEKQHLTNFLQSIRGEAKPNAEIEVGVKSAMLCLLGNISYRTGRALSIDPKTGHVAGDAEAMKLWGREYRPGWEPKV